MSNPNTTMIQAIVFDKDGTLIQLQPFWSRVVLHVIETIEEEYLKDKEVLNCDWKQDLYRIAGFSMDGEMIEESLVISGTNLDLAKAWFAYLQSHGIALEQSFISNIRTCLAHSYMYGEVVGMEPHIKTLMQQIHQSNIPIFVATSDDYMQTKFCLEKLGLLEYVNFIYAADSGYPSKPNPSILKQLATILNIPTSSILMVGDSCNDMKFARNARAIAIYYDPTSKKNHMPIEADEIINHLDEVLEFL